MSTKRVVEMADGRKVTFGKVAKVNKEILTDTAGRPKSIRFDGDNGETFVAEFADLPHADWILLADGTNVEVWAMAHGFSQKLGDTYAGADSAADCIETARILWDRLCADKWNSDTRGFGASAVLVEACVRAFPKRTKDEVRKILGDMSKADRDALAISPDVKPHFDAVMAERSKGSDIESLKAKFQ